MTRRIVVLLALLGLMAGTTAAQDAKTVLQAASKAMGADNLKTIQITGTGTTGAVGQSYSPNDDWPHFDVPKYTRTIDYTAKSSKEELTRRQGTYPPRGGGGTPIQGEQQQVLIVSGNSAWNLQGTNANPAPAAAEIRQLEIWLTPHGFLKAAMAAPNPTAISVAVSGPSTAGMTQGGRKATIVSFTALGKYRINGTINDQNLVENVQTRIPSPVMGDMLYDLRYADYRDFGGVKFPALIHIHQGEPRLNAGHNSMEIKVTNVQANATVPAVTVPDAVRQAKVPPVRVESQKQADGVWLVAGGTHNSLAVEFRDYVTVVEAPLRGTVAGGHRRSEQARSQTHSGLVNTHHHGTTGRLRRRRPGDHHRDSPGQQRVLRAGRLLAGALDVGADRLYLLSYYANNRTPAIETVNQKFVLSDGARTMDLYPSGLAHNSTMLMVYLPKERILVNADPEALLGAQPPAARRRARSRPANISD